MLTGSCSMMSTYSYTNRFDEVSNYVLDPQEMGCSIAAVHFEGQEKAYIVVGTAYIKEDEYEPSTGRLLAFGIEVCSVKYLQFTCTICSIHNSRC
jgi:CPSF A subunit region